MGPAPIVPPPLHGDKMLHLLDRLDDDFLAQIADVIVGESGEGEPKQKSAISSGEATLAAAAHDQPVAPQLLSSTASGRGRGDQLVGSAATKLESGQDNGCQGLNTWIPLSGALVASLSPSGAFNAPLSPSGAFAAPVSSTLSPKHHLLDHMYACPEPANFEDVIILDSNKDDNENPLTNDLSLTTQSILPGNDECADFPIPKRLHQTKDVNARARKRKSSASSVTSMIADSAYDSPSASSPPASPTSSSLTSSSPTTCSSSPIRGSSSLAQTKSLSHQNQTAANQFQPSRTGSLPSTSVLSITRGALDEGNDSSSGDELASTLDLDLLDSLLSKDILNDMGQVILNEELTMTKCGEDDDDEEESSERFDLFGSEDGNDDLFAGLFGDALKDEDDLVKDFDTSDWESTFNELFPQL